MEDAQPNEVRLACKGSTSVPRIRASSRPFPSYSTRGRGSARTHGYPHNQNRRNIASSVQMAQRAPHHHTQARPSSPYRRNQPFPHNSRPLKRIKGESSEIFINRADKAPERVSAQYHKAGYRKTTQPSIQAKPQGFRSTETEHPVDPQNINAIDKDVMVASRLLAKNRDNQRSIDQSYMVGPRRASPPLARSTQQALVDDPRRIDNQSTSSPSGSTVQEGPVKVSLANMLSPVRPMGTSPAPRRRISIRIEPEEEDIIDLTSDHPSSVAERSSARWTTFRTGTLDVIIPPLLTSDLGVPAPLHTPDMLPRINSRVQTSRKHIPAVTSLPPERNIQRNKTRSVSSIAYHTRDQPLVLEDNPEVLTQAEALALMCSNLPLSLGSRDKPRRVLHGTACNYVVTAHGTVDQIHVTNTLKLDRNIRSPSSPGEESVDDACMVSHRGETVMVLGHAREQNQLSLLKLGHGHTPGAITLRRDWNTSKKPGVSALAALATPSQFVSGGYDHRVHLWDIAEDFSGASVNELDIKHTALVHSLLPIVDTSHKVVSAGADCNVRFFDISSERVGHTIRTSNIPFHAHKTDFRFCTLFEVAHLDTQFELCDHRVVPDRPIQRFGFEAEEKNGRFMKGDSWSHYFICGDRNGNVRLWDLRNVSMPVACLPCFRDQVMQVVRRDSCILACSRKNELACIDFQAG